MRIQIQGGWFEDDPHSYYDEKGNWVVSATQAIKLTGLVDYDGADPEDMAYAARRGSAVHDLARSHFVFGAVDPNWLTDETSGYFNGYMRFLEDTGFDPIGDWVEKGIITTIYGMQVGLTPDIYGLISRVPWVIELKAASCVQDAWSVQTGLQEMGIRNSRRVGCCRRGALQLFKDGKYRLHEHTQHAEDETIAIAALQLVHWRMRHGQDLQKKVAQ